MDAAPLGAGKKKVSSESILLSLSLAILLWEPSVSSEEPCTDDTRGAACSWWAWKWSAAQKIQNKIYTLSLHCHKLLTATMVRIWYRKKKLVQGVIYRRVQYCLGMVSSRSLTALSWSSPQRQGREAWRCLSDAGVTATVQTQRRENYLLARFSSLAHSCCLGFWVAL